MSRAADESCVINYPILLKDTNLFLFSIRFILQTTNPTMGKISYHSFLTLITFLADLHPLCPIHKLATPSGHSCLPSFTFQ